MNKFSKIIISFSFYNQQNNFFTKIIKGKNFSIKSFFSLLIESNLNISSNKMLNWDFILPLSVLTENFYQFQTLQGNLTNSLFVKFGPWISRNNFTYLNLFNLLQQFPFFFHSKTKLFQILNFLFCNCWLQGITFVFYNFLRNYKIQIINIILIICISKIKFKNFKFLPSSLGRNFFKSTISYIRNSRYLNLGFFLNK